MTKESETWTINGFIMILVVLLVYGFAIYGIVSEARAGEAARPVAILIYAVVILLNSICIAGFFQVQPNQGMVLTLFGNYQGTVRENGLQWANPFYHKKAVSLRVRNFETPRLKVNDKDGNPIEIATVVVWKVVDTAEAIFEVDSFENYVHVQCESALRNLATAYPYDSHDDEIVSLRGASGVVSDGLKAEIHDRLMKAGVEVIEARISHLAYAPEIAAAMLQRQQAAAIIAARQRIVDGAVGMVEMALARLSANKVVELDEERRATMVSNLLVVLCGERAAQPVLNAGTLY
jgi:regulator of protease activity HflC (stomatin/prohibitin superfamily)